MASGKASSSVTAQNAVRAPENAMKPVHLTYRSGVLGSDLADDGVTLVPNESEQTVIADVKAMRSRGMKLQQIATRLTERGVPTKTGKSNRWTHQAVARILSRQAGQ